MVVVVVVMVVCVRVRGSLCVVGRQRSQHVIGSGRNRHGRDKPRLAQDLRSLECLDRFRS